VSISINRTSSELGVHEFALTTLDNCVRKLKENSARENEHLVVILNPPLSTNKEFRTNSDTFSDTRIRTCYTRPKDNAAYLSIKDNYSGSRKHVYNQRVALEGLNKIDFMYYLTKRQHFVPVTEKIFSFLRGIDIASMSKVSRTWRNAVRCSLSAKKKQKSYLISVKENRGHVARSHWTSGLSVPNRKALTDISNVMRFSSKIYQNKKVY